MTEENDNPTKDDLMANSHQTYLEPEFVERLETFKAEVEAEGKQDLAEFFDLVKSATEGMSVILENQMNYISLLSVTLTTASEFISHNHHHTLEDDPQLEDYPECLKVLLSRYINAKQYVEAYDERMRMEAEDVPLQ